MTTPSLKEKYVNIKKEYIGVFIGYATITLICTYPAIINFNYLIGPPADNQIFAWNLWWFKYALFNLGSNPFHSSYVFYPVGADLYFHTYSPLNCLVGCILQPLFGLIKTYNILIMGGFILAAAGAYALCRYMALGREASFIGGLIFSYNPFHLAQSQNHLNISSIFLLPLLILYILKAVDKQSLKYAATAGILLAANYYLDFWMFLFGGILILPVLMGMRISDKKVSGMSRLRISLYIFILALILIFPVLIGAFKAAFNENITKPTGYDTYVADLAGFVFPHSEHWLKSIVPDIISRSPGKSCESQVFLGYFTLLAALWAIVKYRHKYKKYFITLGILGLILSLGSYLHIWGIAYKHIKLPYLIIEYIPILNAARVPGRFIILTYLALAMFAALTMDNVISKFKVKKRNFLVIPIVLFSIVFVLIDYCSVPFNVAKIKVPSFWDRLKKDSSAFAVCNIPLGKWEADSRYLYYQTIHNRPILGGILARFDISYYDTLMGQTITKEYLANIQVKYIALYREFLSNERFLAFRGDFVRDFSLIAEEDGISLFQIY